MLERFDRESSIILRISEEHANVPFIFDRGIEDEDRYVIVMELLVGRDLSELIQLNGPFRLHDALYVAAETCKPLATAHRLGVIHRDVKPANIFLCGGGALPAGKAPVRLMDFGIALVSEASSITEENATVGTLLYVAPEAFHHGKHADARVDIYAAGIVALEMLFGMHPMMWEGAVDPTPMSILGWHARGVLLLREARPDLPEAIEKVIAGAVALDPRDRWPSVDVFLGELQRELAILLEGAKLRGEKLETLFSRRPEPDAIAEHFAAEAERARRPAARRDPTPAKERERGAFVHRAEPGESEALAYKATVRDMRPREPSWSTPSPPAAAVAPAPAVAPAQPAPAQHATPAAPPVAPHALTLRATCG